MLLGPSEHAGNILAKEQARRDEGAPWGSGARPSMGLMSGHYIAPTDLPMYIPARDLLKQTVKEVRARRRPSRKRDACLLGAVGGLDRREADMSHSVAY